MKRTEWIEWEKKKGKKKFRLSGPEVGFDSGPCISATPGCAFFIPTGFNMTMNYPHTLIRSMSLSGRACSQLAISRIIKSLISKQATEFCLLHHRPWTLPLQSLFQSHRRLSRCLSDLTRPLPSNDDTIYALSSAQGKAGIAVIRVSGPHCQDVSLSPQFRFRGDAS